MMIPISLDPGGRHRLDPVEEDRLVRDWDQLLGARVGDRAQSGPLAAGEDQALQITRMSPLAHRPTSSAIPAAIAFGGIADSLARVGRLEHDGVPGLLEHLAHEEVRPGVAEVDDHRAVGLLGR